MEALVARESALDVLVVEDDPADARMLQSMLHRTQFASFNVSHVTTLTDALNYLLSNEVDVVVLDLGLPDSSDLDGLLRIRETSPDTPIVVLTGRSDDQLALGSLHAGAEDFLVKGSVDREALTRSIRYAIERHRSVRELANLTKQLQLANTNLEQLALLDPLTEVLNRRGLQQALSREVENVQRDGADVLVLLVDLDDFKRVNDSLGHAVGDIALKEVTRRLRSCVRGVDYLARIGGDEFMLLLPRAHGPEVVRIAERVRLAIATTTIQHSTGTLKMTASIAAVMLAPDTPSIDELLTKTHQILFHSKEGGKNRVSYAGSQFDDTARRLKVQSDMCTSLTDGRHLFAVKQPILRLRDEQIIGYEFLSRFQSGATPEMPDNFFRICSERNILTVVDHHCLKRAIEAAASLPEGMRAHVNLFPSSLVAIPPEHLLRDFAGSGGREFFIEISEQQILGDPTHLLKPLAALREAGVCFGIDDVGFGNSCVESLVLLEPDVIKLDKQCVRGLDHDPTRLRHLERYLKMAASLGAEVVAEGIERREELEIVRDLGVSYGQGYYWGMPA